MLPNLNGLSLQSAAPALALAPNAAVSDAEGELGCADLSAPSALALDLDADQADVDGEARKRFDQLGKLARETVVKTTIGMKSVDGLAYKKYDAVGLRLFLLEVIQTEFDIQNSNPETSALPVMLLYGVNLKSTRVSNVPTLFPRPWRLLGQRTALTRMDGTIEKWKDTVKTSMYNVGGYHGMLRALKMFAARATEDADDSERSTADSTEDEYVFETKDQQLMADRLRKYSKPRSKVTDLSKASIDETLPNMYILNNNDFDDAVRKSLDSSSRLKRRQERQKISERMFGIKALLDDNFLMMATQIGQVIGVAGFKEYGNAYFTSLCNSKYGGNVGEQYHLENDGSKHSLAVDMIVVVPLSEDGTLDKTRARYSYGVRPSSSYDPTKYLTHRQAKQTDTILFPANAMCTFLQSPEVRAACSGRDVVIKNTLVPPGPVVKAGDADAVRFYSWEECAMLSAYAKGTLSVKNIAYGAVVGL